MHRKEVTHSCGSYERKSRGRKLADEMGRGKKIPMVHSKTDAPEERVTCELHDSYFCWMTINHAIRVGNWVGVELLYNSVKAEVRVPVPVGNGVIDEMW